MNTIRTVVIAYTVWPKMSPRAFAQATWYTRPAIPEMKKQALRT
jgi:hypothetical protein